MILKDNTVIQTVIGRKVNGEKLSISEDKWAFTIASREKDNKQIFIILEGFEKKKRSITLLDLFVDIEDDSDPFKIPLQDSFGYVYAKIHTLRQSKAEALAKQCFFHSEIITEDQSNKLLTTIRSQGVPQKSLIGGDLCHRSGYQKI